MREIKFATLLLFQIGPQAERFKSAAANVIRRGPQAAKAWVAPKA